VADPAAETPPRLPRRPDIQSLRALAIALVVAAHAHVPGFQGGYIGVDVFFVLSGYLISGLILAEVERTSRFDPWAFYARRLKRLLPALLLVLAVVAALAWLLASPQRQGDDAAAGQTAAVWMSNFYFAARVINYFSAGLDSNLFLHTWSLAVEEQFYLVWPWLMLFLLGAFRWQGRGLNHRQLTFGLIAVAAASLALGSYLAQAHLEAGFYLMPGRAWEFALGALTFLLRRHCEAGAAPAWLRRHLGRSRFNSAGLLLILAAGMGYDGTLRYPGLWALLPCAGTALFLLDAPERNPASPLSRVVLRQPVLLFLGDISYSLYLWHWPVLLLGGETLGEGGAVRAGLVAASVALAALTYVTLERPMHRAPLRRPAAVLAPAALAMTAAVWGMGVWQGSVHRLLETPAQIGILRAAYDLPALYETPGCDTWYHSARLHPCVIDPKGATHTVVMFGDSVLAQWFPAVADIYLKTPGWRLEVLTKSACSASAVPYFYPRIKALYTVCSVWRERAIRYLQRLRPDVIIMGSTHYDYTPAQWISGTRSVLERLSPAAGSIVLMSPTPELGFNGLSCLSARANWPRWLPPVHACMRPLRPESKNGMTALLERAAAPFANVRVVDLRRAVCPHGICRAQVDGRIAYRDGQHLTASFVRSLAPSLRRALRRDGVSY